MGCTQTKNTKGKLQRKKTELYLNSRKTDLESNNITASSSRMTRILFSQTFDCLNLDLTFISTFKNLNPTFLSAQNEESLCQTLIRRFIFILLSFEKLRVLIRNMKVYSLTAGQKIFSEGETCNYYLYLKKGIIEVNRNGEFITHINEGQGFGELSLICAYTPTVSLVAAEDCEVCLLSKADYVRHIKTKLMLKIKSVFQAIQDCKILNKLQDQEQELLINALTCTKFSENQNINKEILTSSALHVVGKGKFGIYNNRRLESEKEKSEYFIQKSGDCIKALTKSILFTLNISELDNKLRDSVLQNLYKDSVRTTIRKSKILNQLSSQQQESIVEYIKFADLAKDEKLEKVAKKDLEILVFVIKGEISFDNQVLKSSTCLGVEELYSNSQFPSIGNWKANANSKLGIISVSDLEIALGKSLFDSVLYNKILNSLERVEIFNTLSRPAIERLVTTVTEKKFANNESVYQEGQTDNCFYILITGRVKIYKGSNLIRQVENFGYFGQSCLILNSPRSTSVISKGSSCWVLKKSDILPYISPSVTAAIKRSIIPETISSNLEDFSPTKFLGNGTFGTVALCKDLKSKNNFAMKSIQKSLISRFDIETHILSEKKTLMFMDHPFVVHLYKTFNSDTRVYFLLEYIQGIEFFDLMNKFKNFDIVEAKFYSACLIEIVEYMHDRKIVYRDLKPENIIIDSDGYPKLVDFGMAKIMKNRTSTSLGTPNYMAPEVVKGQDYGLEADLWSFGVMLYQLITGKLPFGSNTRNPMEIYNEICTKNLDFGLVKNQQGKDLLEKLLNRAPKKRGNCASIKKSAWFAKTEFDLLLKKRAEVPYKPSQVETKDSPREINDFEGFFKKYEKRGEDFEVFSPCLTNF